MSLSERLEFRKFECNEHGGTWTDEVGGRCRISDPVRREMYLEHIVDYDLHTLLRIKHNLDEQEQQIYNTYVGGTVEIDPIAPLQTRLDYVGVDPDAPVVQNEKGGKQSLVEGMFNEIPPLAMFELAKVMEHGAKKYGAKNWHQIEVESHVNHLLMHVFAWLAGDRQEKHLTHALARAAMAVEMEERNGLR